MYSKVAIVKPDHVGDLILAVPAIGWILKQVKHTHLFVASGNLGLARYLFPQIDVSAINFSHLEKSAATRGPGLGDVLAPLKEFDVTVFLRSDGIINRDNLARFMQRMIVPSASDVLHDSIIHWQCISKYFGEYNRDQFWPGKDRLMDPFPKRVGLCIASGFPTNKWSVIRWAKLAEVLCKQYGIEAFLIGGKGEVSELRIIASVAGIGDDHIIVGDATFDTLLNQVRNLDVVIASDGGGGHLCSLAAPVLTVAGSSPFRRYAPFGKSNRVVSMDLTCSPCLNAHHSLLNACFSHECCYGIGVDDVLSALKAPLAVAGARRPLEHGAHLFYSPSHARNSIAKGS